MIGSQDGIHWDRESDSFIHLVHSDTCNSIVYDTKRERYVMTCRAKDRYRRGRGEMIDTGASRRISRMESAHLWTEWKATPQTILNPDRLDAAENFHAFYGMPLNSDREATSLDSVDQVIRWGGGRSLDELAGTVLRIEFSIRDAKLYGFSAQRN